MRRRTWKSRICRLLATISPLTIAEIHDALDEVGSDEGVTRNTAANQIGVLRRLGIVRAVPASPRQQMRYTGRQGLRQKVSAWELVP